ncbi:MAG: hypothetical protein FWG06_01850 [Clostridiales bacterium]|nr:hypothetical protein [Clostridiales bacterium]
MNLINFYIPEWFWVAFNLLVLFLVLKKILWKPVLAVLEKRQDKVVQAEQDAEEAARLKLEMEQLRAGLDEDMETKTAQLMQEARSRAGREFDRIVAEAEAKADLIISAAKNKARREREVMLVEMKGQVVSTAVEATGLLLRANMDSEQNKRLLQDFLAEEDVSA